MVETPSPFVLSQQSRRERRNEEELRAAAREGARAPGSEAARTARSAAEAALDKKAEDVLLVDLGGRSSYADFLVLCSGTSDRQLEAIADSVWMKLKEDGHRLVGKEGGSGGRWLLLDFGDVVVHVFHQDERGHYDLEGLWADAPQVRIQPRPIAAREPAPAAP